MCEFVREIKPRKIQSCLPFFSSLPFFSPSLPLSVNGGSKKRKEEITFDFPLIVEERVEGNARGRYVPLVRKKDTRNIINCGGCDRSRVLFYSRYTSSFHTYVYLFLILFFFLPPPLSLLSIPRQETLGELMREILGWMEVLSPASNSFIKSNKLDRYAPAIPCFLLIKERGRGRRGRRKTETTFPFQVWRRFFEASKKRKGGRKRWG